MAQLSVVKGDITRTASVDAIVTLINSEGMWFGGVDGAIQRVAGGQYHAQASAYMSRFTLRDGMVILAKGSRSQHRGAFDNVIFVIDDLVLPLNDLVYKALVCADNASFRSVALPLMRTGVMMGVVEKNVREVVQEMRLGIDRYLAEAVEDMNITIVVYDDPAAIALLEQSMRQLGR